jgi:ferredoxin-like protein FixX
MTEEERQKVLAEYVKEQKRLAALPHDVVVTSDDVDGCVLCGVCRICGEKIGQYHARSCPGALYNPPYWGCVVIEGERYWYLLS